MHEPFKNAKMCNGHLVYFFSVACWRQNFRVNCGPKPIRPHKKCFSVVAACRAWAAEINVLCPLLLMLLLLVLLHG
jgi:hypothetical protein